MSASALQLSLLREVSRSFYLTLRVLPGRIRTPIGLAYLLARTTDTIADTELVAVDLRLQALEALRRRIAGLDQRIAGSDQTSLNFGGLARQQGIPAERVLLENCEESLALLQAQPSEDQRLIRQVLDIIASGQELDLRRFAGASADNVLALGTEQDLDDYTYRVAGCVGEFWTRICRAQLFPKAPLDDAFLLTQGVRFGKGLQLVNILRDLPTDLRHGRCYLPADKLAGLALKPHDLLDPSAEARLRPLYNPWLERAEAHLLAGWAYTNTLPRRCVRVRLACAWPILIGLSTLRLLRVENVLDPCRHIKVSRRDVKRLMLRSLLLYPYPAAWRRLATPS
jgi:farnesyl-diphosphate farnesyltransferase